MRFVDIVTDDPEAGENIASDLKQAGSERSPIACAFRL